MRKFKFMSKAVVGMMAVAMTMGSLSGVATMQPIGVYAAAGDVTISGTGIVDGAVSVEQGGTLALTVATEGNADDTYTWSVTTSVDGAKDTDITVDNDNNLTVAADAVAGAYTVKATSAADNQNFAEITVTVTVKTQTEADVTITADGLADGAVTVVLGTELQFAATTKDDPDDTYTWSISSEPTGAVADKVAIDENGKLVVGADATVGAYKVKAVSKTDTSKLAEVTVNVVEKTDDKEDGAETTLTPHYDSFTLDIKGATDAKYAFLEVWKFGTKEATGFDKSESSKDKLSYTYSYELTGGEVTVDLSFLKATTKQGIKVYTDKNVTKAELVIGEQPAKLSGLRYNSAKKAFDTSKAKEGKTPLASTFDETLYEYRGQYANDWEPLESLKDVNHISAGSTIIIRKEATDKNPAGPEAKIKITAAAKAPKITVDYKKGTVKFSDKMMYGANGVAFVQAPKDAVTLTALRTTMGNAPADKDLVVFAYTKGDESKGKPDSNVASVIIPAEKEAKNVDSVITVAGDSESKVTCKVDKTGSGTKEKQVYTFTVTGKDFEISTVAPTETDRGWKAISSKKAYTIELKDTVQYVYIRKAGEKGKAKDGSDSRFPSGEVKVEVPAKSSGDTDQGDTLSAEANGVVKLGTDTVVTIARDDAGKIAFTVAANKGGLLEYLIGEESETNKWATIEQTMAIEKDEAVTIKVRVKGVADASKVVNVSIDAKPLSPAEAPTQADGVVSIGTDKVVTIARDGSSGQITFNVEAEKGGLLEYLIGEESETNKWTTIEQTTAAVTNDAAVTIKVRVKATTTAGASAAVDVAIAAKPTV